MNKEVQSSLLLRVVYVSTLLMVWVGCQSNSNKRIAEYPEMYIEANPTITDAWDGYDAEMLYERGIHFYDAQQYADAIPYFARVTEVFPSSPEFKPSYYFLALSHLELEQGPEALRSIDSFIDLRSRLLPPTQAECGTHPIGGLFTTPISPIH